MISEFTGKERDTETGLDYFGARYMSAAQGRFTSPDLPLIDQRPEDPQSWNLYSYARNNPITNTDPSGRYVCGASMTVGQCDEFEAGRMAAQTSADKLKERMALNQRVIRTLNERSTRTACAVSITAFQFPFDPWEIAGLEARRG